MAAILTNTAAGKTTAATKTGAAPAHKQGATGQFGTGKYREIIIAVALFLLFDLGVLILNFYTSF